MLVIGFGEKLGLGASSERRIDGGVGAGVRRGQNPFCHSGSREATYQRGNRQAGEKEYMQEFCNADRLQTKVFYLTGMVGWWKIWGQCYTLSLRTIIHSVVLLDRLSSSFPPLTPYPPLQRDMISGLQASLEREKRQVADLSAALEREKITVSCQIDIRPLLSLPTFSFHERRAANR